MLLSVLTQSSGCRPSRLPPNGQHLVLGPLIVLVDDRAAASTSTL